MRRLFDNLTCILVTLCMFSFPLLLLGLAPWMADSMLSRLHIHLGSSPLSILGAVLLMMASAGALMVVAVPAFALLHRALLRLADFSTWLLSAGQAVVRSLESNERRGGTAAAAQRNRRRVGELVSGAGANGADAARSRGSRAEVRSVRPQSPGAGRSRV